MAVYTALIDAELSALLMQYDLGALQACEGIEQGVENTNYALTTPRGRFVLTIFEKRVAESDLPFFMRMMAHLAERGFPAPLPMPARDGAFITRVQNKPAAIVTFLEGDWLRAPNITHCAAIGEALAHMHVALHDFKDERPNALGPDGWEALIRPRLAEADALRPGLGALIARDLEETRAAWPAQLPRGAIHADLFPDNALFTGDRLTGVIDFYFACTDFLAYDLAVALNAWCFADERAYDIDRGHAMISAYESVRPLGDAERAALSILCRGAALRFFATRLADWTSTPPGALVKPKNPLEYADKLAFHRGVQGPADYGA